MKMIENSEKKPLRIFTHVSEYDNGAKMPEETYHNWVMANKRTAAALRPRATTIASSLAGYQTLRRQSLRSNARRYTRLDVAWLPR